MAPTNTVATNPCLFVFKRQATRSFYSARTRPYIRYVNVLASAPAPAGTSSLTGHYSHHQQSACATAIEQCHVTPCVAFTELAGAGDERQYRREVLDDGSGSALKVACCQESTHLMPRLGVGRMVTHTQHASSVCYAWLVAVSIAPSTLVAGARSVAGRRQQCYASTRSHQTLLAISGC